MEEQIMSLEETMEFLNIKKPTILAWIRDKKLKPARLGRSRKMYFFKSTILEDLKANEGAPYHYKK